MRLMGCEGVETFLQVYNDFGFLAARVEDRHSID